jgi:hypothetical protein
MPRRTIEEIIEMGQDAIGEEVARLAKADPPHCRWCGKGQQLAGYVRAALAIRKDVREQALMKNLGDVRDADLMKMIASELDITVEALQDFIADAKAAKAGRARAS